MMKYWNTIVTICLLTKIFNTALKLIYEYNKKNDFLEHIAFPILVKKNYYFLNYYKNFFIFFCNFLKSRLSK